MKRLLKWIGYTVGGLVAIIVVALVAVYVLSSRRMNKTLPPTQAAADAEAMAIPSDSATVSRGHHLVIAVAKCTYCHGDNLAGKMISNDRGICAPLESEPHAREGRHRLDLHQCRLRSSDSLRCESRDGKPLDLHAFRRVHSFQ